MNLKKLISIVGLSVSFAVLTACGGGSSESGSTSFGGGSSGGGNPGSGGTPPPIVPTAADLVVSLDKLSVANTGTETVTATVTAVDVSRNVVSAVPVTVTVDGNAIVQVSGDATSATGTLTATVGIGADRSNRTITVRVVSGSLERIAAFQVIGARLSSTAVPAVATAGQANNKVDFRLTDANSNAMPNVAISVEAAGLPSVNALTGPNGEYAYTYSAPSTPGTLTVTARAAGVTQQTTVQIQGGGSTTIPSPTQAILSASATANPSVVAINEGTSTSNRVEIRALFLGANNSPIQNVRVRFDLDGDSNSIGGALSSGSSIVYSDVNGVSSVSYTPGSRSSPTDGLTVRACYGDSEAVLSNGACPNAARTRLTVSSEPLGVSIGFNNEIASGAGGLTYIKQFVVLVVDSSGKAKSDVQITPSIDLIEYFKGAYLAKQQRISVVCMNEDVNRNGVLEVGEDINANGQLDPRKSDVAISVLGNGKTSVNGTAIVQIEYPENVGSWLKYKILVSASGVSGTEGRAEKIDVLSVSADDLNGTATPAFAVSPYGTAAACTNPN